MEGQSIVSRQEPVLHMDTNARRNFVKYYNKLDEKPSSTIRFYDQNDCYTVHGTDDCEQVAKIVYKSTAYVHSLLPDNKEETILYVTLSRGNFELAVRELLLVRNLRVEVYIKRTEWELEYHGSPGNLLQFEDILFANKEVLVGNSIISLKLDSRTQRRVGVAAVEQNDCTFHLLEFVDDDFFSELEATVVLLGPKECLLPTVDGEYTAVKALLDRNGIMVTVSKTNNAAEPNDLIQDLNRLLRFNKGQQKDSTGLKELQMQLAADALRLVIKYLELTSDAGNTGHYELGQLDLNRFVHLDSAAVAALNILPKPGTYPTMPSYRWQSILGVLNHCRTPQGHRLISQWVRQPLRSWEVLNDRHNIVQCLLESPETLNTLSLHDLKRIPDILMLTKKIMRRKATLQDLFRIFQVILCTPKILQLLLSLENITVQNMLCNPFKSFLDDLKGLKQMVEQVVDFEAIEKGEFLVKGSFDSRLMELQQTMTELYTEMDRLKTKCNDELNLDGKQVKLENVAKLGYHFRITLKDDSVLRKNKNYRVMDVIKGGVRFTSDKLESYADEFANCRTRYKEKQQSIVEEIIRVAVGYAAPLTSLNNKIAQLDCLVSFAIAARCAPTPFVRPKMLLEGSGQLVLKDVRHPCLELQEHVNFIPNSVEFQVDKCNMFIITGPNMGGKSTYIRSVGTAVLLAHVGAFVPCSAATISMVDSILGRIGASDNIVKGLSTFMVEMIETSGIIRTATNKSLVIIDELGRGTSTYEGCGIAWSIAEHLAKETKCFTLFATHFHEIPKLSETLPTVKNCHMAAVANADSFTLLYEVRPGVSEKSFGIQAAQLANFPEHVVHNAQEVYQEFEDEHAAKQSIEDSALLEKIQVAIEHLATVGNNVEINVNLTQLVARFANDIKQLDSDYFKSVLKSTDSYKEKQA